MLSEFKSQPMMPERPNVAEVPIGSVRIVWDKLLPEIERAVSSGQGDGTTVENMLLSVLSGKLKMWVINDIEACVLFSVRKNVNGLKLFIDLIAGKNMDSWANELQSLLLDYKDLVGAQCIEASCRPGLSRKLMKLGWNRKAVVMELT